MMTEEKQDFAQEPPLTDGEVKLLRLLLQRVASPDFDFGFCGPRTGGPEDFGPRAVSVSRSPLLTPADFRAAGVPRPELPEDHFGNFVFWVVVGLFALWLLANRLAGACRLCRVASEPFSPTFAATGSSGNFWPQGTVMAPKTLPTRELDGKRYRKQ